MNDELKSLVEANIELTKENNKMLRKIRGAQKRGRLLSLLYWLVVIGVAVGGFYYIQPYFQKTKEILGAVSGTMDKVNDFTDTNLLNSLFNQIGGKK